MKTKKTLYQKHIDINPEAHKLAISLGMAGLCTDIPTADVILQVFEKMKTKKGKFDLKTACKIRESVEQKYPQK